MYTLTPSALVENIQYVTEELTFSISCRLKRTSPTAYCDCWEKCKCKTLIAGQKSARLDLLYRLLTTTNLVTMPNSRQVHIFNDWDRIFIYYF